MSKTMKICIGAGVTILIVAAVILGVLLAAYPLGVSSTPATTMPVSPVTEDVTTGLSAEPISSSEQISLKAFATTSTDESGEEVSSVTLTATISPAEAAEFVKCDWTLTWDLAPINGANPVENYISMTVPEDGSKTITLTLVQEFLSDSARVTCTIRGTSYQASVLVKNTSEPTFVIPNDYTIFGNYLGSYYDDELGETIHCYDRNQNNFVEGSWSGILAVPNNLSKLELQNAKGYVSEDWQLTGIENHAHEIVGGQTVTVQQYEYSIIGGFGDPIGEPVAIDMANAPTDENLLAIYNYIIEGGAIAEGDEMHVKNGEMIEEAIAVTADAHYKITSIAGTMIHKYSAYFTAAIMNGETVASQKSVPLTIFVRLVDIDGIEIGGGDDFGEVIL